MNSNNLIFYNLSPRERFSQIRMKVNPIYPKPNKILLLMKIGKYNPLLVQ